MSKSKKAAKTRRYPELFFIINDKTLSEKDILEKLKKEIAKGKDVNAQNDKNETLMDICVNKNYEDIKEFLIDTADKSGNKVEVKSTVVNKDVNTSSKSSLSVTDSKNASSSRETYDKDSSVGIEGSLFQIKLLAIFLFRGIKKNVAFGLATEAEKAYKLDDLVFKYKNKHGKYESVFLQAKHSVEGTYIISLDELLNLKDKNFSLVKYYFSYKKIMQENIFGTVKYAIIYTNSSLHNDVLKHVKPFTFDDEDLTRDILDLGKPFNDTLSRFNDSFAKELKKKIDEYNLTILAMDFVKNIIDHKILIVDDNSDFIVNNVVCVKDNDNITLSDNFINDKNLDSNTSIFRKNLKRELIINKDNIIDDIKENLNKLTKKQQENLNKLTEEQQANSTIHKTNFESMLAVSSDDVDIRIEDFSVYVQCTDLKIESCNSIYSNLGDIEDYLKCLIMATKQPNEIILGDIIESEIGKDFPLNNLTSQFAANYIYRKLIDWFREWVEPNQGRFLNDYDGDMIMKEIISNINIFMSTAYNCELIQEIKNYDISFKEQVMISLRQKLQEMSGDGSNLIHLISKEGNPLTLIKLILALDSKEYFYMKSNTLPETKNRVKTYLHTNVYNGLVIEISEDVDHALCQGVFKNLDDCPHKRVILISSTDVFSQDSEHYTLKNIAYQKCEIQHSFLDLSDCSKAKLLSNCIVTFQGRNVKLNQIIDTNMEQLINVETMSKLIFNEYINISRPPVTLCDLEVSYLKVYHEVPYEILKNKLTTLHQNSPLYVLSGYEDDIFLNLIELLQFNENDTNAMKKQTQNIKEINKGVNNISDYRIVIFDKQTNTFQHKNFKRICQMHPNKLVYWIELQKNCFILRKIYNPSFYIPRIFDYKKRLLNKQNFKYLLTSKIKKDVLIFCGLNKERLINILNLNVIEVNSFENLITSQHIYIQENLFNMENVFYPNELSNTHWFNIIEGDDSNLIWKYSQGSIESIRVITGIETGNATICEENLFSSYFSDQSVIIADDQGVGKTTALTSLIEQIKENKWIIRINIKDCYVAIDSLPSDYSLFSIENIINFFKNFKEIDIESNFTRSLLEYRLKNVTSLRPLVLIFDGFDELNLATKRNKIINLLKYLKYNTVCTMWIATVNTFTQVLEDNLLTLAISLKEFKHNQQIEFVCNLWSVFLKLMLNEEQSDDDKLKSFANASITDAYEHHLNGYPLQLRVLSEISLDDVLKCINNKNILFTTDFINSYIIFSKLINFKYDIYYREKHGLCDKYELIIKTSKVGFDKIHQYLAFQHLFPNEMLLCQELFSTNHKRYTQQMEDVIPIGIVTMIQDGRISFYHKTFAEIFVARLFVYYFDGRGEDSDCPVEKFFIGEKFMTYKRNICEFMLEIIRQDLPDFPESIRTFIQSILDQALSE